MNSLFNSEAYLGCMQGTLTFELHIYYKSRHSLVFNSLVSNNCSIYASGSFKNFPATQFFILFDKLSFNKTAIDL